ncbi:MAG TPA: HD domain-containing phosphohydrolase [Vicinamibacterales bacterium]|nr:HD domain-containing phosphohydrolase [Vicinamibacterales bacterium]
MTSGRRPPRLLVKALLITFGTVAALLLLVFLSVRMSVRDQVRRTVTQNLAASQRMLAELEERRLHELRTQAQTLAENPTLKAAMDTYAAEERQGDAAAREPLLATVQRELNKLAARVESDAVALATIDGDTLATAGRLGVTWARGQADARLRPADANPDGQVLIDAAGTLFRVVRVPLTLDDGATIGWLDLGSALDQHYAEVLDRVSQARTAIVHDSTLVATTLSLPEAHDFQDVMRGAPQTSESVVLDGSSHAYREIARVGTAQIYALGSVDAAAAAALSRMNVVLAVLAFGAFALAFVGSTLLARLLSRPIERLSGAIDRMAAARDLTTPLPATGSSRELDRLTTNFNHLMASVVDAESRTEAAYAGAIRALAAALDARDPYTAGHSERVSTLSVAIGRVLRLPETEIEVLRLGALLHDIGKIGISDDVLRKPGPLTDQEFEAIMEHPVLGARILRAIPFLLPHIDIVELHHERPDGLGYPRGLRGDDIPLLARIVHVADAYDAITTARAYRQGRSSEEALRELWRCAGTEYHSDIVGALAQALPRSASGAAPTMDTRRVARPHQAVETLSA